MIKCAALTELELAEGCKQALLMDPNVRKVAEFMAERLNSDTLQSVARGLAAVAPLLWGHLEDRECRLLRLHPIKPSYFVPVPDREPASLPPE